MYAKVEWIANGSNMEIDIFKYGIMIGSIYIDDQAYLKVVSRLV